MFVPLPNLGFQIAISEVGVAPVIGDIIGDIRSITNVKITINSVNTTPIDSPDGVERPAPTTKVISTMPVTLYKRKSSFTKVTSKIIDKPTSDKGFFCRMTVIYPKGSDATDNAPDYSYDGFFSELSWGDGEAEQVQTFGYVFTPIAKLIPFVGPIV